MRWGVGESRCPVDRRRHRDDLRVGVGHGPPAASLAGLARKGRVVALGGAVLTVETDPAAVEERGSEVERPQLTIMQCWPWTVRWRLTGREGLIGDRDTVLGTHRVAGRGSHPNVSKAEASDQATRCGRAVLNPCPEPGEPQRRV